MDITEIIRRWQSGKSIRAIKRETGCDRETIGKYISLSLSCGLNREIKLTGEEIKTIFSNEPAVSTSRSEKTDILLKHADEFKKLVTDKDNPLKAKSTFEVLSERHEFSSSVSYTTFKRFAKTHGIAKDSGKRSACRIEIPPASRIQTDYGKVGFLIDPATNKRRTVFAFTGTSGHSRHKFVGYVFSQNQQSFTESHVKMFSFFGGTTETLRIGNLKSGIIKPGLYNPRLNRTFREMSEYYGVFIDSCRVAAPTDKPIAGRDVQTVREEFRKMIVKNPTGKQQGLFYP